MTLARSFTDSFAGIAPAHAGPFVLAEAAGALLGAVSFGWISGGKPQAR
jgi:membrane protein DedA with SNARE-associated domain